MAVSQLSSSVAFKTLLAATDLSGHSKRGLVCAAALARQSNAKLLVAHVISPEGWRMVSSDELHPALCHDRKMIEKRLSTVLKSEELRGVRADAIIRTGEFRSTLCGIAYEHRADLLIATTHGKKGLSKLLFGSKIEEVCHHAPCPILLVGPKAKIGRQVNFTRILFATDLTALSLASLPLVLAFATQFGAHIKVSRIIAGESDKSLGKEFAIAQTKAEISPVINRAGVTCEPEYDVEFGAAKNMILKAALKWGADVIGIGAQRPGTLATYLPGDLAYDVVCDAHCPVLTIVEG